MEGESSAARGWVGDGGWEAKAYLRSMSNSNFLEEGQQCARLEPGTREAPRDGQVRMTTSGVYFY